MEGRGKDSLPVPASPEENLARRSPVAASYLEAYQAWARILSWTIPSSNRGPKRGSRHKRRASAAAQISASASHCVSNMMKVWNMKSSIGKSRWTWWRCHHRQSRCKGRVRRSGRNLRFQRNCRRERRREDRIKLSKVMIRGRQWWARDSNNFSSPYTFQKSPRYIIQI